MRGAKRLLAEFVVIFVGVLTALAADQWVQAQGDKRAEADYFERLEFDLVTDSAMLAVRLRASAEGLEQLAALLEAIPDQNLVEFPSGRAYPLVGSGVPPTANSSTYDELMSTGNLTLIRDPYLRSILLGYYRDMASRTSDLSLAFSRGRDPLMELSWEAGANAPVDFRALGAQVDRSRLQAAIMRAAAYHDILSINIRAWQGVLTGVLQNVRAARAGTAAP